MRADVLLDENGKLRGMSGRNVYKYNAVVRIEGLYTETSGGGGAWSSIWYVLETTSLSIPAIIWMEKAHELEPENVDILFQIADYYDVQGKNDMVLSTFLRLPSRFFSPAAFRPAAF